MEINHSTIHRQPSAKGVHVLRTVFPNDWERILLEMQSGSHVLNPYHNVVHELQVVYYTWSFMVNDPSWNPVDRKLELDTAIRAGAFHDHNHSGGKYPDSDNIKRARTYVINRGALYETSKKIAEVIDVTEFSNGGFPHHPISLTERAIRDADLCAIYSWEGRQLLIGLAEEMGSPLGTKPSTEQIDKFVDGNAAFLRGAPMHTIQGRRLKDEHLDRCVEQFRHELKDLYV